MADRLVEIYRRDGPDAMAVYCCAKATNEDNYLLQKMYRALFRTNNIDHCTRLCHAGSVIALQQALGSSAMSNTASQVIENDVFIVTGSNTTENHPIIALQMKEAVEKHGARMIVIDPRRIELVDFAELWLPLKPGTNVPVFSAMAHVIVEENLVNHDFVDSRTEGYADFVASLEKFTPEFAEEISGVPAEDIRKAARLYAGARNAAIYWGMGISQLSHGTASALALIHLAFLTGHIGRDGTGLNPLRGQNNVQGASDMGAMPFHYPGYMRVDNEQNAARWERAWHVEPGGLPRKLGLTTTEILSHAHEGGVRSLYIMGENPMMSEPNLNVTRQHMQQLEFLVAQDLFINESAAFADVFLPATPFAEKDGTFTNTDRRVQRVRTAQSPRGQARPDWQIICDLATRLEARLGRPTSAGWKYSSPAEVFAEMARVVPDFAGVTYERIDKIGLQYPVWDLQHPGHADVLHRDLPQGPRQVHAAGLHPGDGGSGRRISVHPDDRARPRALARRLHDAQFRAGRGLSRGAPGDESRGCRDARHHRRHDRARHIPARDRGSACLRDGEDHCGCGLHPHALRRGGCQPADQRCPRSRRPRSRSSRPAPCRCFQRATASWPTLRRFSTGDATELTVRQIPRRRRRCQGMSRFPLRCDGNYLLARPEDPAEIHADAAGCDRAVVGRQQFILGLPRDECGSVFWRIGPYTGCGAPASLQAYSSRS